MAFKMNRSGFHHGNGTGSFRKIEEASALKKVDRLANQSATAAARLAEKKARLEAKLADSTNEKQKARLQNRISNISNKASEKTQQAENLRSGKKRRANIEKSRTRNVGAGKLDTDKTFNESGRKIKVDRTLKDNNDNVIRATEKTKTGKGVNKTVDKTITKSDGTEVIKKVDGERVKKPVEQKKLSFGEAFKQARSSGKAEFTWNGKKYHTGTKDEADAKSKAKQEAAAKAKAEADAKAKASNNNPLVDTNTVTPDIVRTSGGSINTTTYRPTTYGYGKY
jgi:colicin import membrane protein